jgi:hypothetical protein
LFEAGLRSLVSDSGGIEYICAQPLNTQIVGWVKRESGTIFVGFAYLNVPQ